MRPKAGMSLVLDHSGRVFTTKKCSLKDLVANGDVPLLAFMLRFSSPWMLCSDPNKSTGLWGPVKSEAIFAVMQACRKARLSVYEIQKAIHKYYEDCKLYPRGLRTEMGCVQQWGMRMADALAKLAPREDLYRFLLIFLLAIYSSLACSVL